MNCCPRAIRLATLIHARESSSTMIAYSERPSPRPPYSSGMRMPKKPELPAICARRSIGISPDTGSSAFATGSTSFIAKSRAMAWIANRSSVRKVATGASDGVVATVAPVVRVQSCSLTDYQR